MLRVLSFSDNGLPCMRSVNPVALPTESDSPASLASLDRSLTARIAWAVVLDLLGVPFTPPKGLTSE